MASNPQPNKAKPKPRPKKNKLQRSGDDNQYVPENDEWEDESEVEIVMDPIKVSTPSFEKEAKELKDTKLKKEYEAVQQYLKQTRRNVGLKDILQANHLSTAEKAEVIEFYKLLNLAEGHEEANKIKELINSAVLEKSNEYVNPSDTKYLTTQEINKIKQVKTRLSKLEQEEERLHRAKLSLRSQVYLADNLPDKYKRILLEKLENLEGRLEEDPDAVKEAEVVKLVLSLPLGVHKKIYKTKAEIPRVLKTVWENLDKQIGGMTRAKQKIMETLASRFANPNRKGDITVLVGEPGVGKTRLVLSLSEALGIPVEIIPLGGIKDKSVLTGFSSTYVGSQPGKIIQAMKRMGCANGIIFFDEFEKLSDQTNEVSANLINILDPTQNHRFQDEYLQGIEVDISNIWFWASANSVEPIDKILRDRINIIYIPTPKDNEKINVFNQYIFPETLKNVGLVIDKDIKLHPKTAQYLINRAKDLYSEENNKGYRKLVELLDNILKQINLIKQYKSRANNGNNIPSGYPKISFPVELCPELLEKFIRGEDFTTIIEYLDRLGHLYS